MTPWQETAALRNFDPADVCFGSFTSFLPFRRVRFAPRADIRPLPALMSTRPSNFMMRVRSLDLKFLNELAAMMIGISNPPHWLRPFIAATARWVIFRPHASRCVRAVAK
jgi:hypothetical protein